MPLVANSTSLHKTFMDTLGRTTLSLTALNVIDDSRDTHLIVRAPLNPPTSSALLSPSSTLPEASVLGLRGYVDAYLICTDR